MPQNIPALITYEQIWDLAVSMAGQTQDNVTEKDSVLMQVFLAGELPDLWNKEAWPELCDNLTQVSLANNAFSLNQGDPNEMGEILGLYPQDPRNPSHGWDRIRPDRYWTGDGQVYVDTGLAQIWVDYQLPVPDLLDPSLIGQNNEAALMAVTLPNRFRLPLAYRGAGHLVATEDPQLSGMLTKMAEVELGRQAAKLTLPWWRREVRTGGPI